MTVAACVPRRPFALLALAFAVVGLGAGAFLAPADREAGATAVLGLVPPLAAVQSAPRIPPAPSRWATDEAGFLSRQAVAALDARLEEYERRTGHQLLVWIGRSLGEGASIEDWAVRTFEAWKVGRKGIDDGLVLFILAEDRRVRIEVGYGLEGAVPDIYAYRVIDNILLPGFREGRPDAAVDAAVTALMGYIGGDANAAGGDAPRRAARRLEDKAKSIFGVIAFLAILVLFITNPSLALWLLLNILGGGGRGGRGGGGWGGGGGFGGGGGRSGGGGASGSW
ncbi:MAG: TPM domain-containing protein [Candidatus Aminicenantes bacterium]|nr:TPM domain-containing protein [Candidatus Aminicenantes bacterium]